MNLNKLAKFKNIVIILSLLLTGCGGSGGGSGSTVTPDINVPSNTSASDLTFITPKSTLQLGSTASVAYIIVKNPTSSSISNISYSVTKQIGSGSNITLDNGNKCTTLAPGEQCVLQVDVPVESSSGSFSISASNSVTSSSLTKKSLLNFKPGTVSSDSTSTLAIGTGEPVTSTTLSGANGIALSYYDTVIAGSKFIIVNGIVSSSNPGGYNSVVLVNSGGTPLPNQQVLSANLGNNLTNLSQGSVFSILLPVPSGSGATQNFSIQTSQVSGGVTTNIVTGSTNYTVTTTAESSSAILSVLPSALALSGANPSQTVTISNTGNAKADITSLVSNSANVSISPASFSSLDAGDSVTATFSLESTIGSSTNTNASLSYTTSGNTSPQITLISVAQQLTSPPNPINNAVASLSASFSPSSSFSITTSGITTTNYLTLTNTGNTVESNFVISGLPAGFSLSTSLMSAHPCNLSGNTITSLLTPTGLHNSCDVGVTFASTALTSLTNGNLSITYHYDSGQVAPNPASVGFSYSVLFATANLEISNGHPSNSVTIVDNNLDFATIDFVITNTTNIDAHNVIKSITQMGNLFAVEGTSCAAVINANESCTMQIKFGPSSQAHTESATLIFSYIASQGGQTTTNNKMLIGTVESAQSAIINISQSSASSFAGGSGTEQSPYYIEESTSGLITYSVTNNGSVGANNFYLNIPALGPWSVTTNNCGSINSKITLAPEASCSLSLMINSETTGSNNLSFANISPNWTDQAHPAFISKLFSGTAYVSVYAPASISITSVGLSSYGKISQNESFNLVARLNGGYNVPDQNLLLSVNPTESVTFNDNPCIVSSADSECTFGISMGGFTESYDFAISNTTTNGIDVNPSTINVSLPFSCVADGENACGCLIQNDGSESPLMWYGSSLTNNGNGYTFYQESAVLESFNAGDGHCGYTDWRIPNIIVTLNSNQDFPNPQSTGDFGSLGNYATANGFQYRHIESGGGLNAWLNATGFNLTTDCENTTSWCAYWSSDTLFHPIYNPDISYTWLVIINKGAASLITPDSYAFLLPVRGGN